MNIFVTGSSGGYAGQAGLTQPPWVLATQPGVAGVEPEGDAQGVP